MPPLKRKNKTKNGRVPAASARGVRFFDCFVCIKPSVPRPPYEGTARGAIGNSMRRISPPEKVQSSMQNRRACPASRTRVRQGVRSAILRDESAFYFMGTTSTESLRVHIPSVKSGIACACPPAAIDASERAVMHIGMDFPSRRASKKTSNSMASMPP